MKYFKLASIVIALFCFSIISCNKELADKNSPISTSNIEARERGKSCSIDYRHLQDQEVVQLLFSEFLGASMKNKAFQSYLVNEIVTKNYENKRKINSSEIFIVEHLQQVVDDNGSTLESMLTKWMETNYPSYTNLLNDLCTKYASLVIDLPWWAQHQLASNITAEFEFGSVSEVTTFNCEGTEGHFVFTQHDVVFQSLSLPYVGIVPFVTKVAEEHVIYEGDETIFNESIEDVIKQYYGHDKSCEISQSDWLQFVKTIDCSSLKGLDGIKLINFLEQVCSLITFETECDDGIDNDGDGYTDCEDQDCDCPTDEICGDGIDNDEDGYTDCEDQDCDCDDTEICDDGIDNDGDGLIDSNDPDCPCVKNCQRDCNSENNLLVGLKFAGPWMYREVSQAGIGEANCKLNYTFVGVDVCNPETDGANCPVAAVNNASFVLIRPMAHFFDLNVFNYDVNNPVGPEPTDGENGVIAIFYLGNGIYQVWQAWPLYFSTAVPYLADYNGDWNGDKIGDRLKFEVVEQDNSSVTVMQSSSLTVNVSNTASQQNSSGNGNNNGGNNNNGNSNNSNSSSSSFQFTTGVTNSTSLSITERFDQDVQLGEYRLQYCDENATHADPTGAVDANGNPFQWFGIIPNNYPGVPIFHEIRIID